MIGSLLGIDTGGTHTEGVLLDEGSRRIIATPKSQALSSASTAGAVDPHIEIEEKPQGVESWHIRADTIGNLKLNA